jgi:hypothetical protein
MCNRVKNAKPLPGLQDEIFLPGERGDRLEGENLLLGEVSISQTIYNELHRQLDS